MHFYTRRNFHVDNGRILRRSCARHRDDPSGRASTPEMLYIRDDLELNGKWLTAMIETIDKVQLAGLVAHNDARVENFVLVNNEEFYLIDYSHALTV